MRENQRQRGEKEVGTDTERATRRQKDPICARNIFMYIVQFLEVWQFIK